MATLPFPCTATPLSAGGLQSAMDKLKIDPPTIWAMLHVETNGCGYSVSRRPKILYERHIFSGLTHGQYDAAAPDVSNPDPGGYGASGDPQYARLGKAFNLDPAAPDDPSVPTPTRNAALESASWGLGQVLGSNYSDVGFDSAFHMVSAMAASEDLQLQAVVGFVLHKGLDTALQNQKWADYALHYNGKNYAENQYDSKLNDAYTLYQDASKLPNLTVRSAQLLLFLLGNNPGGIDGAAGAHTILALQAFQRANGLPVTSTVDQGAVDALTAALPDAPMLSLA